MWGPSPEYNSLHVFHVRQGERVCTGAHGRIWVQAAKVERGSKDMHIHFLSQSTEECVKGVQYPTQKIGTELGACTPEETEGFQLLCCCLLNQVSIDN